MLSELKMESDQTFTENGARAHRSTRSHCLDFFAVCGALRQVEGSIPYRLFIRAYTEEPDTAMRILFYLRDIREGLGEREVFRGILSRLAMFHPASVRRNIPLIAEYGRWDDLLALFGTPCETNAVKCMEEQFIQDVAAMREGKPVSLLAKWLPSVHTSSAERRAQAKTLRAALKMSEKEYRKTVAALRSRIDILEKRLCASDYTFDYENVPSCAMMKYQKAFFRHDAERYKAYLDRVLSGEARLHADTLFPYQILRKCIHLTAFPGETEQREELVQALDAAWKSLPDYCDGRNALAVIDGSGSMYEGSGVLPADAAMSLGIYFAERNTGFFKDHFITFSATPQLIKLQGMNIAERAEFCMSYNEAANTDLRSVFMLILETALRHHLPQKELPETIYIISDMEFDAGVDTGTFLTDEIRECYSAGGYTLPTLVYWNVDCRNIQFPVRKNDLGAVLVSGASPVIFNMVIHGDISPEAYMYSVVNSERYLPVLA